MRRILLHLLPALAGLFFLAIAVARESAAGGIAALILVPPVTVLGLDALVRWMRRQGAVWLLCFVVHAALPALSAHAFHAAFDEEPHG